jgi:hypothetical protein
MASLPFAPEAAPPEESAAPRAEEGAPEGSSSPAGAAGRGGVSWRSALQRGLSVSLSFLCLAAGCLERRRRVASSSIRAICSLFC